MAKLNRKELSSVANAVARFTNPRSPLAAMQCISIDTSDGIVSISANCVNGYAKATLPCNGKLSAVVNAATFCKTIDLLAADDVVLTEGRNYLEIAGGNSDIKIDRFASWQTVHVGHRTKSIRAKASDIIGCIDLANTVGSNVEIKYANGIRIHTEPETKTLHFSSSTSKSSAFAWCQYDGEDEIDMVASRGGLPGLLRVLSLCDEVSIGDNGSHISFEGESSYSAIPTEREGQKPSSFLKIKSRWADADTWRVNKTQLHEFLRHTMAFATPDASGVYMTPSPSGLNCRYTGISDGTNTADMSVGARCSSVVDGECEGSTEAYISCKSVAPAVQALSENGFVIKSTPSALVFEADNGVVGIAKMVPPQAK